MVESALFHLILEEVRQSGPMTFASFMRMALYHPDFGYYQRRATIGREGDFYTSPHVSPLFGQLVGKQLLEMWRCLGSPAEFQVVEAGAGHGFLAADILEHARRVAGFRDVLRYVVLETSQRFRKEQRERLGREVAWLGSVEELPDDGIVGCVLSNELLDSYPVHRVTVENGQLREIFVTEDRGKLAEIAAEPSTHAFRGYFEALGIDLPEGIRTEVNLGLREWMRDIARKLRSGFVLTFDYGLPAREYYSPARMDGTLRCYRGHRMNARPLDLPGEQDITSHVDFTTLALAGEEVGLKALGFTDQTHFLMGIGEKEITDALASHPGTDLESAKRRSAILNLVHPEMMGGPFRVLIQGKAIGKVCLAGLKNARGKL
jgi:SAM-dependent MidA family methyltransferase